MISLAENKAGKLRLKGGEKVGRSIQFGIKESFQRSVKNWSHLLGNFQGNLNHVLA